MYYLKRFYIIQVNTELKKLLVASVGDDLHFTMEHLVR